MSAAAPSAAVTFLMRDMVLLLQNLPVAVAVAVATSARSRLRWWGEVPPLRAAPSFVKHFVTN
jgi:hypothetical protein